MSTVSQFGSESFDNLAARLRVLTADQVLRIDELLDDVGEYGEVQLVVQRKQLRYINQVQSYRADDGAQIRGSAPPKR